MRDSTIRRVCGTLAAVFAAAVIAWAWTFPPYPYAGVLRVQVNGSGGAGVAIGPHSVVTAAHVARHALKDVAPGEPPHKLSVTAFGEGRQKSTLLWLNRYIDLALLETEKPLPYVRELTCRTPVQGETVTIVGYPSIAGYKAFGPVITKGIVSSLTQPPDWMAGFGEFFITDAKVQPGNSGGPVFDSRGRVIGIAVAMFGQRIQLGIEFEFEPSGYFDGEDVPELPGLFVPNGYSIVIPSSTLCRFLARA